MCRIFLCLLLGSDNIRLKASDRLANDTQLSLRFKSTEPLFMACPVNARATASYQAILSCKTRFRKLSICSCSQIGDSRKLKIKANADPIAVSIMRSFRIDVKSLGYKRWNISNR